MQSIVNAIITFFNNLINSFEDIILWLQDFVLYIPKWIYNHFVTDMVIPLLTWLFSLLPDIVQNINFVQSIAYFLGPFQIGTGLTMIVSAYTVRFIIRRLPFVG